MPFKYVCKGCKEMLRESDTPVPVDDVWKKYEGRCPYCHRDLGRGTSDVRIEGHGTNIGPSDYPPKNPKEDNNKYAKARSDS